MAALLVGDRAAHNQVTLSNHCSAASDIENVAHPPSEHHTPSRKAARLRISSPRRSEPHRMRYRNPAVSRALPADALACLSWLAYLTARNIEREDFLQSE